MRWQVLLCQLLSLVCLVNACQGNDLRVRQRLEDGWRYHLEQPTGDPTASDFDDDAWESVTLPHSHRLYSENLDGTDDTDWQQTWHRHIGWYRRELEISAAPGQRVFLEFEGAHQVTDCWVNGQHVGQHAIGGYTPFHFDITRFAQSGSNQITLRVDNRYNPDIPPDFGKHDYIMPGGLYRDVYLVVTDGMHITFPWDGAGAGVFIRTPQVAQESATVSIDVGIQNDHEQRHTGTLLLEVLSAEDAVLASSELPFNLATGDRTTLSTNLQLTQPQLWSIETPYLHRARMTLLSAQVSKDKENQAQPIAVDQLIERFGIRKLEVSAEQGIRLNGAPIELIGANRHQQYPYIGNAVPDSLHRYDMALLKHAGMNCVRLSHYPQDDAILDACDELGILVTEEPPTWIAAGTGKWIDNLERAQRRMIRNHRNHPCVFAWAVGINHIGYRDYLYRAAKEEDPTRWTHANAAEWGESWELKKGKADIYGEMGFEHPETIMKDTFQFTIEHADGKRGIQQVASARRRPEHLGLCIWELFDNHSLRPKTGATKIVDAGIMDMFRQPKDNYYWYQSELTESPMVHIVNRAPSPDEPVTIYSNCDSIQLTINGKTLGPRKPDSSSLLDGLQSPPFTFEAAWRSGELRAVGYRDGQQAAEAVRQPPGKPHHLTIDLGTLVDPPPLNAATSQLLPVFVRIRDAAGTVVPNATALVELRAASPAFVLGTGKSIDANPCKTRQGYAPFYVQLSAPSDSVRLSAHADGFEPTTLDYRVADSK